MTMNCKGRLFAALGLGLDILDTALYLNQLIREPGVALVQSISLFCAKVLHKVMHVKLHTPSMHVLCFLRQSHYLIIQRIEKSMKTTKQQQQQQVVDLH